MVPAVWKRRVLGLCLALVLGAAVAPMHAQSDGCASTADVACTEYGAVRGVVDGAVVSFRGIPYAQPPTGDLRWRPPQPPAPWTGTRDGSTFGPICPQLEGDDVIGNEDCLTLNVWAPSRRTGQLLPVMVYLTGGGNHSQSGQGGGGGHFVGTRLTREGVVLVTVNIRLGALGFLTHPALDAESKRHTSGNYGTQDHLAMLQWVRRNIRAFGGDPNAVFLFGTSAGGASICGLLTSPLAAELFHGVAMESSVPTGCEYQTKAQAQMRTGTTLATALGCTDARCLRGKSPRELFLALRPNMNLLPRAYGPVVDGYVFPEQPIARIRAGQAAKVPVLMGNNLDEAASWVDQLGPIEGATGYQQALERLFGVALAPRVAAEYPASTFPSPRAAVVRAATDGLFTCMTRRVTTALAATSEAPVYRYLFTYVPELARDRFAGHSTEMPFLYQSWRAYSPTAKDLAVSERLVGFWTRMAKSGRPGVDTWQAVTPRVPAYLEIGETQALKSGEADAHCGFWDVAALPTPHL